MKLYGIAWDGWKALNLGQKDTLIKQVADNWWIYNTYAIKDLTSGKTIAIFTKEEALEMVG